MWKRCLELYGYVRYHAFLSYFMAAFLGWAVGSVFDYLWSQSDVWSLLGLLACSIIAVMVSGIKHRWFHRYVPMGQSPRSHVGLILVLSNEEVAQTAIEYHGEILKHVWFLVTDRTEGIVEGLKAKYASRLTIRMLMIEKIYDPEATAFVVKQAVEQAQKLFLLTKPELICDVTGGTVVMTIGAVTECRRSHIAAQVVPAIYDEQRKRPIPQVPIEVPLNG